MIRATYKRRGRRYCWQGVRSAAMSLAQVSLLRRAGVRLLGVVTSANGVLRVHVRNLVGVIDTAEFSESRRSDALAFIYRAGRDRSPQLSLFQGAL